MKKNSILFLLLLSLSTLRASAANLLQNGSFEQGDPGNFLILSAGSNALAPWEITDGGIEITNGTPNIGPQNGARNIDLDGFYQTGTIAQNFTAQAGKAYLLTFYLSANVAGGPAIKQVEVSVGNKVQVFSYDTAQGECWIKCELPFQAVSNGERLVVRSLSPANNAFGPCLDNFVIEEISCEAECAALQQALADALAALSQANSNVASLAQQLAAAQAQIAALQGSANATETSLARIQADFRTEFNNPGFTLPGATTAEKVDKLANAVIGLNHGRKQGVYNALK